MLKKMKWSIIILAVAYVILGVVLIIFPAHAQRTVAYILAVSMIVFGTVNLIQYMRMDAMLVVDRYDLVIGFSAIIGGILILINMDKFIPMVVVALGFMITISGVLKLQNSINLMRLKNPNWHVPFAMAVINIVYGVVILIDPFSAELLVILMGIGFVLSGITDIIVTVMVSSTLAKITDLALAAEQKAAAYQQQQQQS